MNISKLQAGADWQLIVTADDGGVGSFDVNPFLKEKRLSHFYTDVPICDFWKFDSGTFYWRLSEPVLQ